MSTVSGQVRTRYTADFGLLETPFRRFWVGVGVVVAILIPFVIPTFWLGIANLAAIAVIGALALNLLIGQVGQLSLGTAGFLGAGAFTVGIMVHEWNAPVWVTIPAAVAIGALIGLFVGIPALKLRGIYLTISTLAAHFVIISLTTEYESRGLGGSGLIVSPPSIGDWSLEGERNWYYALLIIVAAVILLTMNLLRSHVGRAWLAIHERDLAASALGVHVSTYKVMGFVISTAMTTLAGALLAYYTGFVTSETFTFMVTIEYIAMVIIGGVGSIVLGSILGAIFVTILPFLVERAVELLPFGNALQMQMFALQNAIFALLLMGFLLLEPRGLVRIWTRIRSYFELWPFRYRIRGG